MYHFIRVSPFDHDCVDEAVKTLTLAVQANQTLAVDRTQVTATYHTGHFPPLADTVQVTAAGGPDPPGQSLRVTVAGDNVIFQAAVSAAPPNGKWLTVAPSAISPRPCITALSP